MPESGPKPSGVLYEPDRLRELGRELQRNATTAFHRASILLSGPRAWGLRCADALLEGFGAQDVITFVHGTAPDSPERHTLEYRNYRSVLGTERDGLILDLHGAFNPDALGAVTGVVRGGGVFICLMPSMEGGVGVQNPNANGLAIHSHSPTDVTGHFFGRLHRTMMSTPGVVHLRADDDHYPDIDGLTAPAFEPFRAQCYRSEDQENAVEKILKVARGRSRRPLVLTADRGRGKSAALGIAAGQLLKEGPRRVSVIAPSARAAEPVFRLAGQVLGLEVSGCANIEFEQGHIRYVAPADLVGELPDSDLVLVDEAAALPTDLLKRLLLNYGRVVFASTVHGYEGTGQGFGIRFRAILDEHCPDWRRFEMHTPIRWAPDDPLEAWTFHALMLSAEPDTIENEWDSNPSDLCVEVIEKIELADDDGLLTRLYGLLVAAHYRTTPADLERILDAPHLRIWAARLNGKIVGTALVAQEGNFEPELARLINLGQRRPAGHLLPEALAVHCGLERAPHLKAQRIVRIATHPGLRRRGIASCLLNEIRAQAITEGIDYLGASFGATESLVPFWRASGFLPVRMGVKRGSSSGLFSTVVLNPVSEDGVRLHSAARGRFGRSFKLLLREQLKMLDPGLVVEMLRGTTRQTGFGHLSEGDWRDVVAFAAGVTTYEASILGLGQLLEAPMESILDTLDGETGELRLVVRKLLQSWSWEDVSADIGVAGRRTAQDRLSTWVRCLVQGIHDPELKTLVLRYALV